MEELLQWLCAIYPLSEDCLAYLRRTVRYRKIKKGQLLLEPGMICENIYFIKKGLLRCYYLIRDEEITDWFFWEMDTVVSIDSFNDQLPSDEFIRALEDSELFYIAHYELDYLFRHYIEFNFIGRVLYNKYLRIWHRQTRILRMPTAEDKYRYLLTHQPEAFLRVPQATLASFIGMAPETISRLRGRRIG